MTSVVEALPIDRSARRALTCTRPRFRAGLAGLRAKLRSLAAVMEARARKSALIAARRNILSRCRLAALLLPDLLAPISLNFGWWTLRGRTGDQEQQREHERHNARLCTHPSLKSAGLP